MANTAKFALPYPLPTAPVAQGAADIRALAEAVDAALVRRIAGQVQGGGAITAGSGFTAARQSTGVYTFAWTVPFSATPAVAASCEGLMIYCAVDQVSATGARVRFVDSAGNPSDQAFCFVAAATTGGLAAAKPAPDDDEAEE